VAKALEEKEARIAARKKRREEMGMPESKTKKSAEK